MLLGADNSDGGIWSTLRTHTLNLLSSISNQGFSETHSNETDENVNYARETHTTFSMKLNVLLVFRCLLMVASKVSRTSGESYILSILKGKTWMLPPLHMKPHGDHDNLLINTQKAPAVCQALP